MGKKKSVVLMTILTIVTAVLCLITALPTFVVPGTAKKWNAAVLKMDFGADLGGGYYAYYYPDGVITETEYDSNLAELTEAIEAAEEGEDKEIAEDEYTEYANSYKQIAGSSLWFSTSDKLEIIKEVDGEFVVTEKFQKAFEAASNEIAARYETKGYSDYRVAVVDKYAIRVEMPISEDAEKASAVLAAFQQTGAMTLKKGGELIDELKNEEYTVGQLIRNIKIKTMNAGRIAYLEIQFTKAGREMIKSIKNDLSLSEAAESGDTSSLVTLDILVGEDTIVSIYKDSIMENNVARVLPVDGMNKDHVRTFEIMMESAIDAGEFDITFSIDAVRTFKPVYGENAKTLLFIAVATAIVAMIVLAIVKMGRFGGVSAYATLTYFFITLLCFAFITGGTFEVTLGSLLIFLVGMVLVNVMQYVIYKAIAAEFAAGKTVESSVKGGYKKTIMTVVDVYVVALLGALALLIGASGVFTLAGQALICVITAAFCNLLWARFINYTYLSASKNKYKYFRFVREDDEDDE